jgi:preprotein translocase subunit SecD
VAAEAFTAITTFTATFSVSANLAQSTKTTLVNMLLTDILIVAPAFRYEDVRGGNVDAAAFSQADTAAAQAGIASDDWRLLALSNPTRQRNAEHVSEPASPADANVADDETFTLDEQLQAEIQREWDLVDSEGVQTSPVRTPSSADQALNTANLSVHALLKATHKAGEAADQDGGTQVAQNESVYRPLILKPRSAELPLPMPSISQTSQKGKTSGAKRVKTQAKNIVQQTSSNKFQMLHEHGDDDDSGDDNDADDVNYQADSMKSNTVNELSSEAAVPSAEGDDPLAPSTTPSNIEPLEAENSENVPSGSNAMQDQWVVV